MTISTGAPKGGGDLSVAAPAGLTQLAAGNVNTPGQIYVQNQSAGVIQVILTNPNATTTTILLDPGAGANRQGGDFSGAISTPGFVGAFTVNGAAGSQVAVWHN